MLIFGAMALLSQHTPSVFYSVYPFSVGTGVRPKQLGKVQPDADDVRANAGRGSLHRCRRDMHDAVLAFSPNYLTLATIRFFIGAIMQVRS